MLVLLTLVTRDRSHETSNDSNFEVINENPNHLRSSALSSTMAPFVTGLRFKQAL
jgi:hypothetical protein